jgi:hypothetical protein
MRAERAGPPEACSTPKTLSLRDTVQSPRQQWCVYVVLLKDGIEAGAKRNTYLEQNS